MRVIVAAAVFLIVGVLVVSVSSKVRRRTHFRSFSTAIADLRVVPARWAGPAAVAAVGSELVVLVLLLVRPGGLVLGLVGATLLFGGFTAVLTMALQRGTTAGCHCFGVSDTPVARRHVARSAFLCLAALGALCGAVLLPGPVPGSLAVPQLLIALSGAGVVVAILVLLDDLSWLFGGASRSP